MSLSKTHPLRLLLPSNITQSSSGEVCNDTSAAGHNKTVISDAVFAFNVPVAPESDTYADSHDLDSKRSTSHGEALCSETRALSDPFLIELPKCPSFSTPKGSLLEASLASKTAFSLPSLHTNSSSTLYNAESSPFSGQLCAPVFQSCSISPTAAQHNLLFSLDSVPIPLDSTDNSYFSDIYATPGPTYYTKHFDDSHSSESTLTPVRTSKTFHWKPFDRKSISRTPSFTYCGSPSGQGQVSFNKTSRPGAIRDPNDIQLADLHNHFAGSDRVMTPDYGRVPLDVYQNNSASHTFPAQPVIVPGSQDLPQVAKTPHPLRRLFAPAANVYISPLGQSPGRTSVSRDRTLKRTSKVFFVL